MENPEKLLRDILEKEKIRIRQSYPSKDVAVVLIEIIRCLDYQTFMLSQDINVKDKEWLLEKYIYGWSLAFSIFYRELKLDEPVPFFLFDTESKAWIDSIIQHSGSINFCNQLLDYKKALLFDLQIKEGNHFIFCNLVRDKEIEHFERRSLAFYHSIMEKVLEKKSALLMENLPNIRKKLKDIVNVFQDDFISYGATPEISNFYSDFGYIYLMTTQTVDYFDEKDKFGGILFKEYIDFAEYSIKMAIMHRDCCMALAEKTAHRIYLRNILTYCFPKDVFIQQASNYFGWEEAKTEKILSCFTINKDNYLYHLSQIKVSPAPYFEIGNNVLMRSTTGCLEMPTFFLIRELKRQFSKDYFNAVNQREKRFKEELYAFFPQERIIKIQDNIIINTDIGITDIDAILFDRERKILGLFQLKWQDPFYSSMTERFSRISNLIPKSIEWIDKVYNWLDNNDAKSILKKLKIDDPTDTIEAIHVFVLSRGHTHFTNQPLDERAIWSSWYQLFEASTKVKDPFSTNPIGELALKLKIFYPEMRKDSGDLYEVKDMEFKFSEYKIEAKYSES